MWKVTDGGPAWKLGFAVEKKKNERSGLSRTIVHDATKAVCSSIRSSAATEAIIINPEASSSLRNAVAKLDALDLEIAELDDQIAVALKEGAARIAGEFSDVNIEKVIADKRSEMMVQIQVGILMAPIVDASREKQASQ